MLDEYKNKYGKIINTDNFRPFFSDVGYKGYNSAAVQEPASYLSKKAFTEALSNEGKYGTLLAGGSGAGKSSAIKKLNSMSDLVDSSSVIFDGNLSSYDSAIKKIKQIQSAGKVPRVIFVYREPIDAFENGVVKRMLLNKEEMGRLVPAKEVAKNHIESFKTAQKLKKDGYIVHFIDNSLGGKVNVVSAEDMAKKVKMPNVVQLTSKMKQIAKKLYAKGTITKDQLTGYIR